MGNHKVKWTSEEEGALKAGVAKHGTGRWKNILRDPEFARFLTNRSNIDLKDKWRNMGFSTAAQGSKDKSRFSRARPKTISALALSTVQTPLAITSAPENDAIDGSLESPQGSKNAPKYNDMIFEALSSLKCSNGCDLGVIVGFIEQRHEVPQNFRRLLSSKLRRLVLKGKLERVQNCYKIKDATLETEITTPKQKDVLPRPVPNSAVKVSCETMEEAVRIAAYKIADAEEKSFLAAEAVDNAERLSKMAEDAESMLQLFKEIYEQCSRGQIVLLA
ncbi:telomere repeat-binding factor 4 [Nicotiana tabacum]|uniref:MYB transcription factor n=2 Tax=Nicotiana TaxID=4085 RepID=A0A1S4B4Z0_TOBAC|nr:PREDICTED: telomere repeat-binding factor 4-like [Nicotiana sylvestris]XP_016483995.1 PREDICTED: telomere repeat-binding factor 4-like [Nicotiana tabacum]